MNDVSIEEKNFSLQKRLEHSVSRPLMSLNDVMKCNKMTQSCLVSFV